MYKITRRENVLNMKNKQIIVVGASSGIGKQTAIQLSELGSDITLIARRKDKLKEVMNELDNGNHAIYDFDVNNNAEIGNLIKTIVCERGKINGLVYATGVNEDIPLRNLNYERLMNIFNTNYFGFVEFVRQVCKRGRYDQGMRIAAISSVASLLGEKAHIAYSASKAAMDASIRCMAKELGAKGIVINSVAPSMIKTQMYDDFIEQNGENSDANQRTMNRQYLGLGKVEDVSNVIAFLMSEKSRFITGITIPVDGGFSTSC